MENKIVLPCDRHSNETMTQETCYQIWKLHKWIMEFLRKFVNRGIIIYRVNSILKGKGKVFNGQEAPSGESTTTECRVNYQLLVVMY